MAPLLEFDGAASSRVRSFRPFEREWAHLKEEGAVANVRPLNILALKSSHTEQFIPRAFQIVFAAVVLALFYLLVTTPPFPNCPPYAAIQNQQAR
jgi:hypothetical protein